MVHLPYSPEFEKICREIRPSPSTRDKHAIWERLLELQAVATNGPEQQVAPSQPEPAVDGHRPPPTVTPPPPRVARPPEGSGFLFEVETPVPELQPWTIPHEAELSPEHAERRMKMLESVISSMTASASARSSLGTTSAATATTTGFKESRRCT